MCLTNLKYLMFGSLQDLGWASRSPTAWFSQLRSQQLLTYKLTQIPSPNQSQLAHPSSYCTSDCTSYCQFLHKLLHKQHNLSSNHSSSTSASTTQSLILQRVDNWLGLKRIDNWLRTRVDGTQEEAATCPLSNGRTGSPRSKPQSIGRAGSPRSKPQCIGRNRRPRSKPLADIPRSKPLAWM